MGDHPPITPMRCAARQELSGDSYRLYEYIVQHFIGSVCYRMFKYMFMCIHLFVQVASHVGKGQKIYDNNMARLFHSDGNLY